jgi:hypothetical protein
MYHRVVSFESATRVHDTISKKTLHLCTRRCENLKSQIINTAAEHGDEQIGRIKDEETVIVLFVAWSCILLCAMILQP